MAATARSTPVTVRVPGDERSGQARLNGRRVAASLGTASFRWQPRVFRPPDAERLLRQAKPWRGGCHELKPLVAIQRVRLPPGKGAARQPEASLAWRAATPVVKRRQQVMKRRRKPRNRESDDAFIVNRVGAAPEAPLLARRNGSSGVVDRRKVTGWVAREPGRSCSCPWARTLEGGLPARESRPRSVVGPARRRERPEADTNRTGTRGAGWRNQ